MVQAIMSYLRPFGSFSHRLGSLTVTANKRDKCQKAKIGKAKLEKAGEKQLAYERRTFSRLGMILHTGPFQKTARSRRSDSGQRRSAGNKPGSNRANRSGDA
jgi:hypothetical protein